MGTSGIMDKGGVGACSGTPIVASSATLKGSGLMLVGKSVAEGKLNIGGEGERGTIDMLCKPACSSGLTTIEGDRAAVGLFIDKS